MSPADTHTYTHAHTHTKQMRTAGKSKHRAAHTFEELAVPHTSAHTHTHTYTHTHTQNKYAPLLKANTALPTHLRSWQSCMYALHCAYISSPWLDASNTLRACAFKTESSCRCTPAYQKIALSVIYTER